MIANGAMMDFSRSLNRWVIALKHYPLHALQLVRKICLETMKTLQIQFAPYAIQFVLRAMDPLHQIAFHVSLALIKIAHNA